MRCLLALAALPAFLVMLAACEPSPFDARSRRHDVRPGQRFAVWSERIGHLGSRYKPRSLVVSNDHRRLAWIDERPGGCRVVVDRRRGPNLESCGRPHFSPDGTVVAYWGIPVDLEEATEVQLFVNGEPASMPVDEEGVLRFARRGGAWAAAARALPTPPLDSRRIVVFDARGPLGEHADTTPPAVSPDGKHVAYLAADDAGRTSLVLDGKVKRTFGPPTVEHQRPVKNERRGPNLEPESSIAYLPDGTLVYTTLAEGGWTVFHDDEVWATYPVLRVPPEIGIETLDPTMAEKSALLAGSLVVAESAATACWWERAAGPMAAWRVVCNARPVDDVTCETFWSDQPITVAADGRSAAYACRSTTEVPSPDDRVPKNLWVVASGRRLGPHRFVWGIDLSDDGRHYAYAAADEIDEPWFFVVDGQRFVGPWQQAFPPELSPDGTAVVWAASQVEGGTRVELTFDGVIVAHGEVVMAPPLFRGDDEVQWAIKRGRSVRRLIVSRLPG